MQSEIIDVRIDAILRINDKDAAVLEYLLGHEVEKIFCDQCSSEFSVERINAVLSRLHEACAKVTRAKKQALRASSPKSWG